MRAPHSFAFSPALRGQNLRSVSATTAILAVLGLAACSPATDAPAANETQAAETGPSMSDTSLVMASDPAALGFDTAAFEKARADIQAGIDDGVIPGGVLLIARHGEIATLQTIGQQGPTDTAPMTAETIFRIYSMSKPIVSVATMQMVEEGKISLDDPVSKYIPEFAEMSVLIGNGETRPAASEITIRNLMSHESGLIYGIFDPESELGKMYMAAGDVRTDITSLELAKEIADLPLRFDPGTAWHYSRSTDVLGAVIEVADGRPLDEILQARIFTPLGMDDTSFYIPASKADRLAQPPANIPPLSTPLVEAPMLSGGGGLNSTTEDYFRFVEMLRGKGEYRGVRIIKPETLDLMATNLLTDDIDRKNWFYGPVGGFGLGLGILPIDMTEPDDGSYLSWGGYAGTNMWVDPKNDITMVFMMQNNEASDRYRALQRSWVYGGFAK